jgi:large subunit ribosomal protein L10
MPNKQKADQVAALTERFQHAASVAVTDYSGLTVEKATLLRKELRQKNVGYLVAKNTLLKIAAHQAGLKDIDPYLTGQTAIAFGTEDPGPMAKVLFDFGKTSEKPKIKAIFIEGRLYTGAEIERVAKLPGREQLLSQVIGNIIAPLQNFMFTLNAVTRDFVGTVEALKEKQSKSQ